jgi:hypothetical protein
MTLRKHLGRTFVQFGLVFLAMTTFQSCEKDEEGKKEPEPELLAPNVNIVSPEDRSAIYIDGNYTGKDTPFEFDDLSTGYHTIGIGQYKSENYLEREVKIEKLESTDGKTPVFEVELTEDDLVQPRTWKVLFVGVSNVKGIDNSGDERTLTYTSEQLDMGFDFLKYSFQKYAEPFSYNTIHWEYDRKDIIVDTVQLNKDNFITPDVIDPYLKKMGVKRGDYDFIMTWSRFQYKPSSEWEGPKDLSHFNGIGWFNKTATYTRASYMLIRYYADIEAQLDKAKRQDPGMIVHEWLHTVAETFYSDFGVPLMDPNKGGGSSLHALESYGYRWPWMTGYKELMRGQINEISRNNNLNPNDEEYVGITPGDFIDHTVRDEAN